MGAATRLAAHGIHGCKVVKSLDFFRLTLGIQRAMFGS